MNSLRLTLHVCLVALLSLDAWAQDTAERTLTTAQYDTLRERGYWKWSPRQKYHDAVVRIQSGNAGGSGAIVWADEKFTVGYVFTAAHVISNGQPVKVIWQNGYSASARRSATNSAIDGAILIVDPPENTPVIPISKYDPQPGETIEHCGFGGPGNNLRHFHATYSHRRNGQFESQCYLLNGDSGGPVVYRGCLIGCNGGGKTKREVGVAGGGWPIHWPAWGCSRGGVVGLFGRICDPRRGGCPPNGGGGDWYPPQPNQDVPVNPFPSEPTQPTIDYSKIQIDYSKIPIDYSHLTPIPGPPGPTGPQGPIGKTGPKAEISDEQIAAIGRAVFMKVMEELPTEDELVAKIIAKIEVPTKQDVSVWVKESRAAEPLSIEETARITDLVLQQLPKITINVIDKNGVEAPPQTQDLSKGDANFYFRFGNSFKVVREAGK